MPLKQLKRFIYLKPIDFIGFVCLAALFFFLVACSSKTVSSRDKLSEPAEGAGSNLDATENQQLQARELKDELAIGREMAAKLYGTFGSFGSSDKEDSKNPLKYINLVGKSLAYQSGRPELVFRFGILETQDINAFAAPGGYILVTRGVLKLAKNESELAGVLAHEIAHVSHKHMYKDIAPKRSVTAGESVTRFLSGGKSDIGGALTKAVSEGMKKLLEEGLSPEKEFEADATALSLVLTMGYNPWDYIRFLERLEKTVAKAEVTKTHPSFKDRIEKAKRFSAENGIKDQMAANKVQLEKRFTESMIK